MGIPSASLGLSFPLEGQRCPSHFLRGGARGAVMTQRELHAGSPQVPAVVFIVIPGRAGLNRWEGVNDLLGGGEGGGLQQ